MVLLQGHPNVRKKICKERNMIVRKVRGQNKIGKVILSSAEFEAVKKQGIPIAFYIGQQLVFIAKKRKWHWYLNRSKA